MLDQLVEVGFIAMGIDYSMKLARANFEQQDGNPVAQYVHYNDKNSWKAKFFCQDAEVRLLRDSAPMTRTGNQYRFLHRSMLEYFFSRAIHDPIAPVINHREANSDFAPEPPVDQAPDSNRSLYHKNLLTELSVIQFLSERVQHSPGFKEELLAVIELSKTNPEASLAAANAITILVRAGVCFNGADLQGIQIPVADLSDGQFDSAML